MIIFPIDAIFFHHNITALRPPTTTLYTHCIYIIYYIICSCCGVAHHIIYLYLYYMRKFRPWHWCSANRRVSAFEGTTVTFIPVHKHIIPMLSNCCTLYKVHVIALAFCVQTRSWTWTRRIFIRTSLDLAHILKSDFNTPYPTLYYNIILLYILWLY